MTKKIRRKCAALFCGSGILLGSCCLPNNFLCDTMSGTVDAVTTALVNAYVLGPIMGVVVPE